MPSFDDHQLKLALTWHLVEEVVGADASVGVAERRYQDVLFPRDVLVQEGFCDEDGVLTAELELARRQALAELPGRLSLDAKLEIVTMCVDAVVVDDSVDPRELGAVRAAARVLGLTDAELDAHLDALPSIGTLDADDLLLDE
jgi:hypothetical protein